MADRITQLQDAINQLSNHFCNSIGVLQQDSLPTGQEPDSSHKDATSTGATTTTTTTQDANTMLFASLITRTAQDIDILIDSLPSHEYTEEMQVQSLQKLEAENQECCRILRETISKGEALLECIRKAQKEIAETQLELRAQVSASKN
ncbi:mediator of RNA polymerase II transcription subunit 21-like [Dysidea avara]|uniref:mediator of RNA polymerase II transcription subunit 21-like n=1 Tax=Dysidea avara TaxID=196820 RepID=UPI003317C6CC